MDDRQAKYSRTTHRKRALQALAETPPNARRLAALARRAQQREEVTFKFQECFLEPCAGPIGPCKESCELPIDPIGAASFAIASFRGDGQ